MEAVASTISNRLHSNFPHLNQGGNVDKVLESYEGSQGPIPHPQNVLDNQAFDGAKFIAERVLSENWKDNVSGATHFDTNKNSFDKYSDKLEFVAKIGNHYFFKEKK